MNEQEYLKLVKSYEKKPPYLKDFAISFLVGGILASFFHIIVIIFMFFKLSESNSIALTLLSYILTACMFTGKGIFDELVSKFKFGLIIPITGFAHSVCSSILDNKQDGLITGMGSNAFKLAGSVILYGIIAAFVCSIIKVIIYG